MKQRIKQIELITATHYESFAVGEDDVESIVNGYESIGNDVLVDKYTIYKKGERAVKVYATVPHKVTYFKEEE